MTEFKNSVTVKIADNEYWWGGSVEDGIKNPFSKKSEYSFDVLRDGSNQVMPMYLSSCGRYLWCDGAFAVSFKNGEITMSSDTEVLLVNAGTSLKDAYIHAMKNHFPFNGKPLSHKFFETAQYNTWMEFTYNPTQAGVLKYAHDIIDNGFAPGVLIIDEGWQQDYGYWSFDKLKFPDPKAMVEELHAMGFTVMLWVCPYVISSGMDFSLKGLYSSWGKKSEDQLFLRVDDKFGSTALVRWWNGYSAMLDFTKKCDWDFMDSQLKSLMSEYGIDGFKFDGGALTSYSNISVVNGKLPKDKTPEVLNTAWNEFARSYEFHECKNCWKGGGCLTVHRLQDKNHSWDSNGINTLIPHTLLVSLLGHPFICPDMIGGGEWSLNIDPNFKVDEELFIRMAQVSAFCPMMQFSWAPWRALSKESLEIVKKAAALHRDLAEEICALVEKSELSGEPIMRAMDYEFPGCGYETVCDQFMFGAEILVAPVVKQGETVKNVILPKGNWKGCDGNLYEGGRTLEFAAPIDVIPYFRKV